MSSTCACRRRSCACATTSTRAATTTRTASRCASRPSSRGTRSAPTTSTPVSPTSSPRTGDEELEAVLERLWHDVVDTKLYITGGAGALYDGASPDGSPWQDQISRVHQAYGRAYPAAEHHRAQRVVREHRPDPVERADAVAHRRRQVRRRHRAGGLQQPAVEHQPRRLGVLLHEPAAPGARPSLPAASPGRYGPPPDAAAPAVRRAAARAVPQLLLLPAEHRAHPGAVPRARGIRRRGRTVRPPVRRQRRSTSRPRTAAGSPCARTATTPGARRSPSPSRMPRAAASRSTCASPAGRRARSSPSTVSRWRRASPAPTPVSSASGSRATSSS